MKRAFTLIEMLIVVALIATLMTIVLRLSAVSSDDANRNATVTRLARLENCLSGYYAAYGNYPPVRLHNTRDINKGVNGHGVQSDDATAVSLWGWDVKQFIRETTAGASSSQEEEREAWSQVDAACRAQPFGAEFPFAQNDENKADIKALSDSLKDHVDDDDFVNYPKSGKQYDVLKAGFGGLQDDNLGKFDSEAVSWRELQLFQFGVMSFLLPRMQLMLGFNTTMFGEKNGKCLYAQWNANNIKEVHDPFDGDTITIKELNDLVRAVKQDPESTSKERIKLENVTPDAVCARWIPNLTGICSGSRPTSFYGVTVTDSSSSILTPNDDPYSSPPALHIYSKNGSGTSEQYILDSMTVLDGWGSEFYYYSPSPHQTYRLWSGGKNKRTFPPWISRDKLDTKARECVSAWTADDIMGMGY